MIPPGCLVVHNSAAFTGAVVLLKKMQQPKSYHPDMEACEFHKGQIGVVVSSIDDWCLVLAPNGIGWCKAIMLTIRKERFDENDD